MESGRCSRVVVGIVDPNVLASSLLIAGWKTEVWGIPRGQLVIVVDIVWMAGIINSLLVAWWNRRERLCEYCRHDVRSVRLIHKSACQEDDAIDQMEMPPNQPTFLNSNRSEAYYNLPIMQVMWFHENLQEREVCLIMLTRNIPQSCSPSRMLHIIRNFDHYQCNGQGCKAEHIKPACRNRCHYLHENVEAACNRWQKRTQPELHPYLGVVLSMSPTNFDRHAKMKNKSKWTD